MKNKKFFVAVLLLAATALLFSSCAFQMNTQQKAHYEGFITGLKNSAAIWEISADTVKSTLETANLGAASLNYQIEDKNAGKPIAKGTSEEDLRKRFVAKKK